MYCIDTDMHTTQLLIITYSNNNNINRKPLQKSIILIISKKHYQQQQPARTRTTVQLPDQPLGSTIGLRNAYQAGGDPTAWPLAFGVLDWKDRPRATSPARWFDTHPCFMIRGIYICIHIEIIYVNRFLASWCMYVPLDQPIKVMCGVPIFRHLLDVFHQRDRPRWRCWPKISSEAYQGNDERAVSARISGPWVPKAAPRYL